MHHSTSQPTPVQTLVAQSDFIGFVRTGQFRADSHGIYKQELDTSQVDSLKGQLGSSGLSGNPLLWVTSNPVPSWSYPTRCLETGEYLVFLRRHAVPSDAPKAWTVDAAFRVVYRPNYFGTVSGMVLSESQQELSLPVVRESLERLIAQKALSPDTNRRLSALFKRAARPAKPLAHEERLRETLKLAAIIRPGMSRADINKIFPIEDGGLSGPSATRYYVGSEVMAEVPFDQTGGNWKPENRVTGPIKVYKSLMHFD